MVALRDGQAVKCGRGGVVVAGTDTVPTQHRWQTGSARYQQARLPLSAHYADSQCSCSIEDAQAKKKSDPFSRWVREVAKHNCQHKAILAIADKMARIGRAVLAKDLHYNSQLL